jgi:prepilin-type N-terminal cleavage/methylation domain-containing protein
MIRRAFTLIELVLTIVIVGIVSLSFPLIMMQSSNNLEVAAQQEAVLAAKTYIGTILSHSWDVNSLTATDDAMILETNSANPDTAADDEFDRATDAFGNPTNRRLGNIDGYGRRRLVDGGIANPFPTARGALNWGNDVDRIDVDDFDDLVENLAINAADMDYMFSLTLTPTILYVNDRDDYTQNTINFNFLSNDAGGITNIKMIAVNAVNANPPTDITLRAYSANIGEFELLKRMDGEW